MKIKSKTEGTVAANPNNPNANANASNALASSSQSTALSTTVMPYSGMPGGVKIGTVTSSVGGGLTVGVYAEAVSGGVQFWVQVESGSADLRGFFLDVGPSGGSITKAGSNDNNMNGTGYSFDYGVEIGTSGSSPDFFTNATFMLSDPAGGSLASMLDGATFGIRATSVGGGGSVKLIGEASLPEVIVSITSNGDVLENAPAVFTVSLNLPLDEDLLVTLSNADSVTIPKGSTSVLYTDGTQGDDVYIDPDSISVSIASAVPQGPTMITVKIDTDPAVVNITDTIDEVIVRLSATPSTSEDGGSIIYTVRLETTTGSTPVSTTYPVTVTLAGGEVIVIPAGASSADSDPVPVNRDDVWVEIDAIGNSIISVAETNAGTPGAFELLTYDDTPVSTQILDDVDPVTVGIFAAEAERRSDDAAAFTIQIDQPLDSPLLVTLSTGDTLTIPAGTTEVPYLLESPPPGSTTVSIVSAEVTGKTFESLSISPSSATVPDNPPSDDNFPTLDNNISHITIYFSAAAGSGLESLDTRGGSSTGGQSGPDGLYTVKIDWLANDTSFKDLDDVWGDIYGTLLELDPTLTGKPVLGVAIKAGSDEQFYEFDGDTDIDPLPERFVDGVAVNTLVIASAIDKVYTSDENDNGRNDFFEPSGSFVPPSSLVLNGATPV